MVIVASLTQGADQTLTLDHYIRVLGDQYHWDVILVTFRIAALTTLISLLLGYPLAWYLVRVVASAWRRACVILLVVPMFTSNIVRSFGWMVLLGRKGLVNQSLAGNRTDRYADTFPGHGTRDPDRPGVHPAALHRARGRQCPGPSRPGLEQASRSGDQPPPRDVFPCGAAADHARIISGSIMVFTLAASAYVTPALLSGEGSLCSRC